MKRWDYGGIETALNGLTGWIEEHIRPKGNIHERYNITLKMVVEYGEANIPGYKKRGHLNNAADYVAKSIQRDNKFNHFTGWVLKNYKQTD